MRDGTPYSGPYGSEVDSVAWRVAPGVAPKASLYAIKVFGGGGLTSSSIVVQALNWAADPNQDGNTSDRLDVVNLSLGSAFGEDGDADPEVAAVERLTRLGCVVVMSAGNGGNAVFKLDSPGTAPSGCGPDWRMAAPRSPTRPSPSASIGMRTMNRPST